MMIFVLITIISVLSVVLFYIFHMKLKNNRKRPTTEYKERVSTREINEAINDKQNRNAIRKGELGEYKINVQLEQLSNDFKYINDILIRVDKSLHQIDHVLITPVGVFAIETKNLMGKIYGKPTYKNWIQYIDGYKRYFYNPIRQNAGHIKALKTLLKSYNNIDYYSVISFTRRCELNIDLNLRTPQSEILVVYDTNLSDLMLRKYHILLNTKGKQLLNNSEITKIYDFITASNITDPAIRQEHIEEVNSKKFILDNKK